MHIVVFPPPEGPTKATFSPSFIDKLISDKTFLSVSLYPNETSLNLILPFTPFNSFASSSSNMSISESIISIKRSIPVIPLWNCSANSTILLTVASRVVTYNVYTNKSAGWIRPFIINIPPAINKTKYIIPSNIQVIILNPAIYLYVSFLVPKNFLLSCVNFSASISSFANAFTTLTPNKLSSNLEFNSPI